MAPYLLLGFLIAGLLHVYVKKETITQYLGGKNLKSVLYASLLGIPLPLCSCGVIPTGISFHNNGASKGASVSFLISTPQTGVDSILVTYSLLGLPLAILRPIIALVSGILGGILTNWLDVKAEKPQPKAKAESEQKTATQAPSFSSGFSLNVDALEGTMQETINFAKKLNPDTASFAIMTPFPGTEVRKILEEEGKIYEDNWSNYNSLAGKAVFEYGELRRDIMERMYRKAYKEFYIRPSYVIKRILMTNSWLKFKRELNGFFTLLEM